MVVIPAKAGHEVKLWRYPAFSGCRIKSGMTTPFLFLSGH
jgi:hypothetical protein